HYEDLLADDSVIAWTEPPFDKSLYSGDDGPARTPMAPASDLTTRPWRLRENPLGSGGRPLLDFRRPCERSRRWYP
ncbi:hypothetical protein, partial [Streptomyces alfalfae]